MKLSVIIPVYNVAPYLRDCLDSVAVALACCSVQSEIICVDDGSTDGSAQILDDAVSSFDLQPSTFVFCVIHQENAGVSAARNRGVEAATGEWIAFVDADDKVGEHRFEHFITVAEETGAEVIRLGWRDWKTEGEESHSLPVMDSIDWESVTQDGCVWSMCYRRKVIGETRFVVGLGFSEDTVFNLNVLTKQGVKFVQREGDDYWYRWREGSGCRRMIGSREWMMIAQEVSRIKFQDFGTAVSWWFLTHLIWWIAEGKERERETELRAKLNEMRKVGLIRIAAIKAKYRWAMWLWIKARWRMPMKLMAFAVQVERWRRKCASTSI